MQLYAGIDLHSNNSYLGISDEEDRRHYKKRLPNEPDVILAELEPYRTDLVGIVVESTFNWYWLVDVLMDSGYRVHLANPAGIQKDKGLKHSGDKHDAFWLARLLRLGILAEGERAISTTNRNFVGRMGHTKSEVYLASPAVAAASAVLGRIAHPDEL